MFNCRLLNADVVLWPDLIRNSAIVTEQYRGLSFPFVQLSFLSAPRNILNRTNTSKVESIVGETKILNVNSIRT